MLEYITAADNFKKLIQKTRFWRLLFLDKTVCISYIFIFTMYKERNDPQMKKTKLYAVIFAIGLCFTASAQVAVSVGKVTEVEDNNTRRYTGLVESPAVVQIIPQVSGEILSVKFKEGSPVKEGDILYEIDPTKYKAALQSADARIKEINANLDYARKDFERNETLFKSNAASLDKMEIAKSKLAALEASLLSAEAEKIRAADELKHCTIRAPHSGIMGVTKFAAGNYVTPNSGALATLIKVRPCRVKFSISTADYHRMFGNPRTLKEEGQVRLKLSSGSDYNEDGRITIINNEANSKTDAIVLYAEFPNKDFGLIIGSTVSVTLSKKTGTKSIAVPASALVYDNDGSFVYAVDPATKKVTKKYVIPGSMIGKYQLLQPVKLSATQGVSIGDTVVTRGTHKLYPGAEITEVPEVTNP